MVFRLSSFALRLCLYKEADVICAHHNYPRHLRSIFSNNRLFQIIGHMRFDKLVHDLMHFGTCGDDVARLQILIIKRKIGNHTARFLYQ